MNKREVIAKVSCESGINELECVKIVDALEKVLEEELSYGKGRMEKIYSILSRINNRKRKYTSK